MFSLYRRLVITLNTNPNRSDSNIAEEKQYFIMTVSKFFINKVFFFEIGTTWKWHINFDDVPLRSVSFRARGCSNQPLTGRIKAV